MSIVLLMGSYLKRYFIYLIRWQLSSPLYAIFYATLLTLNYGYWVVSALANLVGAFLFFFVDKLIFNKSMPLTKKSFIGYNIRWQTVTPFCVLLLAILESHINSYIYISIITNFIGGLLYFHIDKLIFSHIPLGAHWAVQENVNCSDCGKLARGYRLVKTKNYDMTKDKNPKFRCEPCSTKKSEILRESGILV